MRWPIPCLCRCGNWTVMAFVVLTVALGMAVPAGAASISINLWDASAGNVDFNNVDPGEVAGVVPIDGAYWNNVGFAHGNSDHTLTAGVIDDQGNADAATFASTLTSGWVAFSGAVGAAPESGDRDMMASYVSWDSADDGDSPDDVGDLSVTGLGTAFTDSGYDVYIYSDSDNNARTFDITVTPEGGAGTTLTVVDSATFSGDFNKGGSGTDENYVVFRGLTAAGFRVDMVSTPGRGAVNAIQVVAVPEPASIVMLIAGVIGILVTGWRQFRE